MSKIRALGGRKKIILGAITLVLVFAFAMCFSVLADEYAKGQVIVNKSASDDNHDGIYDVTIGVKGMPFTSSTSQLFDVVLVVDTSGSMKEKMPNDNSTKRIEAARNAAKNFVNSILTANQNNKVALVEFAGSGYQLLDFTNVQSDLEDEIDDLRAGGGTNIQEGLMYARDYIQGARSNTNKVVILLSDGEPTYSLAYTYWNTGNGYIYYDQMRATQYPDYLINSGNGDDYHRLHADRTIIEANKIRALGAQVYTVGIGSTPNMDDRAGE